MALSQLAITDFRNLAAVELEPLMEGFNFLFGANGSGKTSLLEAIYYLGHRRSFRSINIERLVRYNSEKFNLFSKIKDEKGQVIPLGVERLQDGDFRVRVAGEDVATIFELAAYLPMRLINVHSHYLLEGSPLFRRKYLDWGVFYQNKEFHQIWLRFNRFLKQRNAALRRRASPAELCSWSEKLAESAQIFHELRLSYLEQLLPVLRALLVNDITGLFDPSQLSIDYQAGWDLSRPYEEILKESLPRDLERGHTHSGPHRADLSVKINGIPAKDVLSTGQQKLLVCGMILAQGALLAKLVNKRPIYLIDDLPSELDQRSRSWLIRTLAEQQAQIFVTAVEEEAMSSILAETASPVKMFHVKHGAIREVEPCST